MKMPRKLAKKPRSWSSNICNKDRIQSLVTFWGISKGTYLVETSLSVQTMETSI
jgi:hypothetical protein